MSAPGAPPPFETIVSEYGPLISRIASSYEADPSLREDLMQQIFLAVWQALPSWLAENLHRPGRAEPLHFVRYEAGAAGPGRRIARKNRGRCSQSRGAGHSNE